MIAYREAAEQAIYKWELEGEVKKGTITKEEAMKKAHEDAETLPLEELESRVYATGSMTNAMESIVKELKGKGIEVTDEEVEEYKKAILEGPEDAEILKTFKEKIEKTGNTNEMMISTLRDIHDGWVRTNEGKFSAREKKHQHMPLEIIGWNEVESDLLFLKPVLEASNIEVDEKELQEEYNKTVEKFLEDKQIETTEDLQKEITTGTKFYEALEGQEDIIKSISDPEFVKEVVIPQIEKNGVGNVEEIVARKQKEITPEDIEEATAEKVTIEGINKQTKQIKDEINPEKEEEKEGTSLGDE